MKIKVTITDDHPLVTQGLQLVLAHESDIEVLSSFSNGADLMTWLTNHTCDILLLDIYLQDCSGLDLCLRISELYPDIHVIAISGQDESIVVSQMLQNGASGYVLKNAEGEEIVQAIREVFSGKTFLCRRTQAAVRKHPGTLSGVPKITRREREVLMLIAEGLTTTEIADQLFISPHTVESHRKNLMEKFQVKNTTSVIHTVKRLGII